MKKIKHRLLYLATLLVWSMFLPAVQAGALQDFDGQSKSISDFAGKGKWLVVMIWASDCHICNQEAYAYVDFHFAHADDDAQVLGITIDGQAKKADAQKFIERHKVNFPSLIGEPADVAQLFSELTGVYFVGTPAFLIYDPSGKLRVQQVGAVPPELIENFIKQNTTASK
ncbi:MAG: TlpA family protein disulfide reductase [Gammaproteobacteria bacterium]|nr:TlpA family protein disulfide reductase [Gammaproteobacteria bacterium]